MSFLTPDQVAERYQISPDSLKEWRYSRCPSSYIGKRVATARLTYCGGSRSRRPLPVPALPDNGEGRAPTATRPRTNNHRDQRPRHPTVLGRRPERPVSWDAVKRVLELGPAPGSPTGSSACCWSWPTD